MLRQNFCGLYSAAQNPNSCHHRQRDRGHWHRRRCLAVPQGLICSPTTAKRVHGLLPVPAPRWADWQTRCHPWVFMASLAAQQLTQVPTQTASPFLRLHTYGLDDKLWYGTAAIAWQDAPSGTRRWVMPSGPRRGGL